MKILLPKLKNKDWIQEQLVEIVGDCFVIGIALVGAYYIRVFVM